LLLQKPGNPVAVRNQQVPTVFGREEANNFRSRAMATVVMSTYSIALFHCGLRKAIVTRRVLTQAVKDLDDRGRRLLRLPDVNRNAVLPIGVY